MKNENVIINENVNNNIFVSIFFSFYSQIAKYTYQIHIPLNVTCLMSQMTHNNSLIVLYRNLRNSTTILRKIFTTTCQNRYQFQPPQNKA